MKNFHLIDLTHTITADLPVWPGDPPARISTVADGEQQGYFLQQLTIGEHSGTHVGAPRHFSANGADMAAIALEQLFLPVIVIEKKAIAEDGTAPLLSLDYLLNWEKVHGLIPAAAAVLLSTGWSEFWDSPQRYWGPAFPGIASEAAAYLVQKRGVKVVGIDSPGLDGAASRDYRSNKIVAAAGALHLENLTNLNKLPERGAWLFIGALPIAGGSGSPARVVAFIPATKEVTDDLFS